MFRTCRRSVSLCKALAFSECVRHMIALGKPPPVFVSNCGDWVLTRPSQRNHHARTRASEPARVFCDEYHPQNPCTLCVRVCVLYACLCGIYSDDHANSINSYVCTNTHSTLTQKKQTHARSRRHPNAYAREHLHEDNQFAAVVFGVLLLLVSVPSRAVCCSLGRWVALMNFDVMSICGAAAASAVVGMIIMMTTSIKDRVATVCPLQTIVKATSQPTQAGDGRALLIVPQAEGLSRAKVSQRPNKKKNPRSLATQARRQPKQQYICLVYMYVYI